MGRLAAILKLGMAGMLYPLDRTGSGLPNTDPDEKDTGNTERCINEGGHGQVQPRDTAPYCFI